MKLSVEENKRLIISLLNEAYACRAYNLKRSSKLTKKALDLSRKIKDMALIAKSLSHFSLFSMIMADYENALQMAEEAVQYFRELKDEKGIADAKYNIAGVYYKTDNFHLGLVNLIDCITTYRKLKDYHNLSRAHKSLGTIYEYFGDQKNAIHTYEQAIAAAKNAGDLDLESNAYNPLSAIYLKQNKLEEASEMIERATVIKQQSGDMRGLAFSFYGRGKVNVALKKFKEAENDFNEAIKIHKQMGETLGLGMAYHKMAKLYVEMGLLKKAKKALAKALDFSISRNVVLVIYKCYYLFYQIYKIEKDPVNALNNLELYHRQKEMVINSQTQKIIENYELITQMESVEKEARLQLEKAEIIRKKDLAEHTARVKQDFLSTMSHEIRTPLNAIITIASLLKEKADKEEQQLVDSLKFASNNLLMIINDILDFTKLDSGKASLELRPGNFKLLLENIKNTYETLAKEKGLALNLIIEPAVSDHYEFDEIKTSQILGNLITNAIKFTANGKVDISVKKLKGTAADDLLLFEVCDTGTGIAENHLEEIFNSFSQPQSITTRKQGGSGLGLAIVKKLVALHGSTIRVNSVVGQGSVFYYELNVKKCNSPQKIISKKPDNLDGKTVLLAEDNLINAMLIGKLLAKWNMVAEHAKNGLEAVE